jgi:hypothetical protein
MPESGFLFDYLSTREGCNKSIRHIEVLHDVIKDFESEANLADTLNSLLQDETIHQDQVLPILHSLLVDKYEYAYQSYNLERNIDDFGAITNIVKLWDAFDIVVVYFHPELGVLPINAKRMSHWEATQWLQKHELVTIFVGEFAQTGTKADLYPSCIKKLIEILSKTGKVEVPKAFHIGKYPLVEEKRAKSEPAKKNGAAPKKRIARPAEAPARKKRIESEKPSYQELEQAYKAAETKKTTVKTMSKMYGICVTNELFHNGNVEAWKRIVRSYEYAYPGNQVAIYYDNERINDINTLFVWGKVKRGRVILISVVGNELKDIAKLRRYLEEGASINFHRFIKGNPNMILHLFG